MKSIEKHKFEAVSLLTTQSGSLDVTIIPAEGQPDWLVPSNLILAIEPMTERIWNYLWEGQDVSVYHLIDKETAPEKIVVLEGNTEVHRLALQVSGDIRSIEAKISDIRDTELPEGFVSIGADSEVTAPRLRLDENGIGLPFIFQATAIDGVVCIVPDLDTIAYQLVDLDG